MILAGTELIYFIEVHTILCFRFLMKIVVIICWWELLRDGLGNSQWVGSNCTGYRLLYVFFYYYYFPFPFCPINLSLSQPMSFYFFSLQFSLPHHSGFLFFIAPGILLGNCSKNKFLFNFLFKFLLYDTHLLKNTIIWWMWFIFVRTVCVFLLCFQVSDR